MHWNIFFFQSSALSKKVEKIQFILLRKADHELHERLNELDILPQVYGMWASDIFVFVTCYA